MRVCGKLETFPSFQTSSRAAWMILTSKCPDWSPISQEGPIPAGHGADLCCHSFPDIPPLHRIPSPNAALHSQECPPSDSWLNMLQQQHGFLAKKESHTKLHRERLQVQPQPHPKTWRAKCLGASSWLQTLHPQQAHPPCHSIPQQAPISLCECADMVLPRLPAQPAV